MIINRDGIEYEKKDGMDFWIVNGQSKGHITKNLYIPEEIDGYPVTLIGKDAFRKNQMLRYVTLPDTIQIIGDHAFCDSQKIKKVEIYKTSNTYALPIRIMRGAFENCVELYEVHFNKEIDLVDFRIQPSSQFDSCPMLHIFEGELVNIVPKWAFRYCLSLCNVTFANQVNITPYAFVHCDNLNTLIFKDGDVECSPANLKLFKNKTICCEMGSKLSELAYEGYNIKIL